MEKEIHEKYKFDYEKWILFIFLCTIDFTSIERLCFYKGRYDCLNKISKKKRLGGYNKKEKKNVKTKIYDFNLELIIENIKEEQSTNFF